MSVHGPVLHRAPCPSCGSRDNVAVYEDGYEKCFGQGCEYFAMPIGDDDDSRPQPAARLRDDDNLRGDSSLRDAVVEPLPARNITLETCEKFKYQKATYKGRKCQVANYYRDGTWVCAKLRFADKGFMMIGDGANAPLYGQHLWRDGGKRLVITEGEVDALSMSQVQGNRWPVVSIPNGAQSAVAAVKRELEWVEKFDTVVFMFDMDEPGQAAAKAAAELLTPGKATIATLPLKDANEMLKAGRVKELVDAQWGAKTFRPDGIVNGSDLVDIVRPEKMEPGIPYPWPALSEMLMGIHDAPRIVTFTAGEGIGKSTMVREIAYDLGVNHGENIGYIGLEESVGESARHIMGLHCNQRLALDFRGDEELDSEEREVRREAFDATLGTGRYFFYDHFGSTDVDNLLSRIRYLARGCDCRRIVLDHLSIVVSAMDDSSGLDERKLIDRTMTLLRMLVEETGITLFLVCHLSDPGIGQSYADGAVPRLNKLRGSRAIGQVSDIVVAAARNMMDEDDPSRMDLWVLKSRQVGKLGRADTLRYNYETGRLELVTDFDDNQGGDF